MNISIPKISGKTLTIPGVKEILKCLALVTLARTSFFGMHPLGLAYAATFSAGNSFLAFFGLCFGMANFGSASIKYILTFFIYYMLNLFGKLPTVKIRASVLFILTAVSLWTTRFVSGITPSVVLITVAETLLITGLYLLFSVSHEKTPLANFGKMVFFGGILSGLTGAVIPYINVSLPVFCGIFVALCLTYSCELPLAALASGILAFVMSAGSKDAIGYFGAFVLSGALGSLLSVYGRLGAVTGFLCGMCVSALYSGGMGEVGILDVLAPLFVFAVLPEAVHYRISGIISRQFEEKEDREPALRGRIVRQLKTVAGAVCGLADGVTSIPDKKESYREICERISQRVCEGCSLYENCKKQNFAEKNAKEIWEVMESDGYCDTSNMPRIFGQTCLRSERFLNEFGHIYELYKQNTILTGAAQSSRDIMARQYSEISNVIELLSRGVELAEVEYDAGNRRFFPKVTVRQEPKSGQNISGDAITFFEKDSKFYVILCDGMGSGEDAGHQSRLTARLFEKFLKAGFDKATSLKMINSALMLKADQESFSTVDILEIDTETGECEFLKVGSAQSFIKRKKEIEVISSKSLPVGILENIDVSSQIFNLASGDIILMMSDGISEAGSGVLKNDWIKKLLLLDKRNPRELADLIMVGAKARARFSDDMTVCVIKIEKRKEV